MAHRPVQAVDLLRLVERLHPVELAAAAHAAAPGAVCWLGQRHRPGCMCRSMWCGCGGRLATWSPGRWRWWPSRWRTGPAWPSWRCILLIHWITLRTLLLTVAELPEFQRNAGKLLSDDDRRARVDYLAGRP